MLDQFTCPAFCSQVHMFARVQLQKAPIFVRNCSLFVILHLICSYEYAKHVLTTCDLCSMFHFVSCTHFLLYIYFLFSFTFVLSV